MRIFFLPVMAALFAAMFLCSAAFANVADPVGPLLQQKSGEVWEKVKEAHKADVAAQNIDALKALAEKEEYAPEAVLVILMMACDGDQKASDYILQEAETESTLAGALSEMGCVFLDYQKSIPALINRLEKTGGDADYYRGVAGTALANLTGVYLDADKKRWQAWWDENNEKFKPDNKIDFDIYRYEIRNGVLTSSLVFHAVGQDDRFMEILADFNKAAGKFTGGRWPLADAAAAMGKGEFDKARQIAEAALKEYPSDIYAMYISASMLLQAGDLKGAQERFAALAALNSQMRSAKFLAAYCGELLAADKKPGEIEILLRLFRALPPEETARGWYVPDLYVFSMAFDRSQQDIVDFAKSHPDKPDLLAGALIMINDPAIRLELVNDGAKKNPDDELLGMLRLQFLAQSGIKQNLADFKAELETLAKLNPDNALPDCMKIFISLKNPWTGVYVDGRIAPLAEDELKAFLDAAGKKRMTALTGRKTEALQAAGREMGEPVWRSKTVTYMNESVVAEPQWVLSPLVMMASVNISNAIAAGDTEKAETIYKAVEALASKVAAEDKSLTNACLAQIMMNHADAGMADGYSRAGKDKEAEKYLKKSRERQSASGISTVQVDPYRWLRVLPVPALSEALSAAMLSDEGDFYKQYPDPTSMEEGE